MPVGKLCFPADGKDNAAVWEGVAKRSFATGVPKQSLGTRKEERPGISP
jgi:hypothetical protein